MKASKKLALKGIICGGLTILSAWSIIITCIFEKHSCEAIRISSIVIIIVEIFLFFLFFLLFNKYFDRAIELEEAERYKPLFDCIDSYIEAHDDTK